MKIKQTLAKEAEDLVAQELLRQKWTILARNFRRVGTEIDIIAWKGKTIAFIEVKSRTMTPKTMQDFHQILSKKKEEPLNAVLFFLCRQTNHKSLTGIPYASTLH